MRKNFYVYVHRDSTGKIFYVGKGQGNRAWRSERHAVWQRYVAERSGGQFAVELVQEALSESEALLAEEDLIAELGPQLVNWVNPGRELDFDAHKIWWTKRKESQRLIGLAKSTAASDPDGAIRACRDALMLVHEYSEMTLESGLVEDLREKNRVGDAEVGDPEVIYRLAQCLKASGKFGELVREVDDYFARYPRARSRARAKATLKLRDWAAARLP